MHNENNNEVYIKESGIDIISDWEEKTHFSPIFIGDLLRACINGIIKIAILVNIIVNIRD